MGEGITNSINDKESILSDDMKLDIRCHCINNTLEKTLDFYNNDESWSEVQPEKYFLDISIKFIKDKYPLFLKKEYILAVVEELLIQWKRENMIGKTIFMLNKEFEKKRENEKKQTNKNLVATLSA